MFPLHCPSIHLWRNPGWIVQYSIFAIGGGGNLLWDLLLLSIWSMSWHRRQASERIIIIFSTYPTYSLCIYLPST